MGGILSYRDARFFYFLTKIIIARYGILFHNFLLKILLVQYLKNENFVLSFSLKKHLLV